MSYAPIEIKRLAVRLFKAGEYTQTEISKIVGYSISAIKAWIAKDRLGIPLSTGKRGHLPCKLDDGDRVKIRRFLNSQPDATIEDVRKVLNYKASKSATHREMVKLGFTFKKNEARQRARKGRCSVGENEVG